MRMQASNCAGSVMCSRAAAWEIELPEQAGVGCGSLSVSEVLGLLLDLLQPQLEAMHNGVAGFWGLDFEVKSGLTADDGETLVRDVRSDIVGSLEEHIRVDSRAALCHVIQPQAFLLASVSLALFL